MTTRISLLLEDTNILSRMFPSYQGQSGRFVQSGSYSQAVGCPNKVCYSPLPLFLINLLIEVIVYKSYDYTKNGSGLQFPVRTVDFSQHAQTTTYAFRSQSVNALHSLPSFAFFQTARITDLESSALKAEMRGHDNRIGCAVFVPPASIPSAWELVTVVNSFLSPCGVAESSINMSSLPPSSPRKWTPLGSNWS